MSSDQELTSLVALLEEDGSLIHTVHITPLCLLLGSPPPWLSPSLLLQSQMVDLGF